jgi:ankyrin repeat protein
MISTRHHLTDAASNGKCRDYSSANRQRRESAYTDGDGWTPLHSASHNGYLGVVKLLLRRGADVDVVNNADKTAAELASENDKAEVAKFLAEYKADVNVRHNTRSNTTQYGADEGGKDGERFHYTLPQKKGNSRR